MSVARVRIITPCCATSWKRPLYRTTTLSGLHFGEGQLAGNAEACHRWADVYAMFG